MEPTQQVSNSSVKKMESSRNLSVSFGNSKSKIEVKKKGHKEGRMKVTLKFGKDEAEGFMNFCKLAKPDNMSQDDFAKFLFYKGVQALQQDFTNKVEEYKQQHPEEFAKVKAELEAIENSVEGSVTIAQDKP
jgi:hypothetical protein